MEIPTSSNTDWKKHRLPKGLNILSNATKNSLNILLKLKEGKLSLNWIALSLSHAHLITRKERNLIFCALHNWGKINFCSIKVEFRLKLGKMSKNNDGTIQKVRADWSVVFIRSHLYLQYSVWIRHLHKVNCTHFLYIPVKRCSYIITVFTLQPVAARSKMWVCGRSLAGIAGSIVTGGMDVCVLTSVVCC